MGQLAGTRRQVEELLSQQIKLPLELNRRFLRKAAAPWRFQRRETHIKSLFWCWIGGTVRGPEIRKCEFKAFQPNIIMGE